MLVIILMRSSDRAHELIRDTESEGMKNYSISDEVIAFELGV